MMIQSMLKVVAGAVSCAAFVAVFSAGCAVGTEGEPAERVAEESAALTRCTSNCDCSLGQVCDYNGGSSKVCFTPVDFGPPPPYTYCFASCQCPYGQTCVTGPYTGLGGQCQSVPASCTSDCDCGVTSVCSNGHCTPDFGPYPECRCDSHCARGWVCNGGICDPQSGGSSGTYAR